MIDGWQILYSFVAILFLSLAYLFYKAKDGGLRIILVWFFLVNSFGMFIRLICGFYEHINSFWNYVIILPVFIVTAILVFYLNSYINKNKEL